MFFITVEIYLQNSVKFTIPFFKLRFWQQIDIFPVPNKYRITFPSFSDYLNKTQRQQSQRVTLLQTQEEKETHHRTAIIAFTLLGYAAV